MIEKCSSKQQWNDIVVKHSGHPLQLWGWGDVKQNSNWEVERVLIRNEARTIIGGAQLLIRPLPKPFTALVYIPRGPFGDSSAVLRELPAYCKKTWHPTHIVIEPNDTDYQPEEGWRKSKNSILLARTLVLDLSRSADELLLAMTKKTRQYIRKSSNDGVVLRRLTTDDEVADCLKIYKQTAKRAKFSLHDEQYYYDIHHHMGDASVIFGAYKGKELVSFVWLAVSNETAFELYGGMNDLGQQLRANYALKWHAITQCKEQGIATYDMNGLLNDGVSTFKQGFAHHETQLAGTFDYPLSPFYYLWEKALPTIKKTVRAIKHS